MLISKFDKITNYEWIIKCDPGETHIMKDMSITNKLTGSRYTCVYSEYSFVLFRDDFECYVWVTSETIDYSYEE